MKPSEIDWSVLRGATILLVISLLVGGTALIVSYQFWSEQDRALRAERSRLQAARSQYHALDDEEDIIATYLPRYVALENQGIIGREQRLDWIDVLRESARGVGLPRLEYVIEAQRPFETGMQLNVGDYQVYASNMQLDMGLLHEEDLLALLERVRRNVSGLFGVNSCEIERRDPVLESGADAVNLNARCVLNFITIRQRDGAQGIGS